LRRRGVTIKEAVACGILIADALSRAHAAGIVHRDVSPANLFITLDRRVKLLDFGIAKLKSSDGEVGTRVKHSTTDRLTLTGTLYYLSPEQALCRDVDSRSDIFSAGVVLYEMLSGRRPFIGPNISTTISRIVYATPKPLADVARNVPAAIQAVVDRCLQKSLEHRYQTAEELRDQLRSAALISTLDSKFRVKSAVVSTVDETEWRTLSSATIPEERVLQIS